MKSNRTTRVAAVAATVLVAGLVAAGPASAAAPRVSGAQLHASILKAASAQSSNEALSPILQGLVSNDPA